MTETKRRNRKRIRGAVVSDRMQKTVRVRVERLVKHRRYGKYLRRYSTFMVHDSHDDARIGDIVEIEQTRPLSRTKCWRLVKIARRAPVARTESTVEAEASQP